MRNVLELLRDIPKELEEHKVVLFLIDGLGINELSLPKRFRRMVVRTVFPSSTPTFFYSFHSLLPPAEHGFLEWYMRFGELIVTIPPWSTIDGIPIELVAPVGKKDIFPFKPLSQLLREKGFSLHFYTPFADTLFTRLTSKGATLTKISFLSEVFPLVDADFVFIYWHSIDSILHQYYKDESFFAELKLLEKFVELLWKKLPEGSKLLVLSDHGLTRLERIYDLPIIDGRLPVGGNRVAFYKDIDLERVEAIFRKQKIPAKVLRLEELEGFEGRISKRCRKNFGEIVALANDNVGFRFPFEPKEASTCGAHGGMSKEELFINVWVAKRV